MKPEQTFKKTEQTFKTRTNIHIQKILQQISKKPLTYTTKYGNM